MSKANSESQSFLDCDIQSCYLKILVDSIHLLCDVEESKGNEFKLSFTLLSLEIDNISFGLCPLVSFAESKYCFLEPLSTISGLQYVCSSKDLVTWCFEEMLSIIMDKRTSEKVPNFYFDVYVAMKISSDELFRQHLFYMAVELGRKNSRTSWISDMVLPETEYFKMKCKLSDEAFIKSLKYDDYDVVLPFNFAGPSMKWWIFLIGTKISWSNTRIESEISRENEQNLNPMLFYQSIPNRNEDQILKKRRSKLNSKCVEIAMERRQSYDIIQSRRGVVRVPRAFVRVRIELPFSTFQTSDLDETASDIYLNIDWTSFRTMITDQEARKFEEIFQIGSL